MGDNQNIKYAPILPFDATYGESFYIYDRIRYSRDIDLSGDVKLQTESGNVIKYYRCEGTKPVIVGRG